MKRKPIGTIIVSLRDQLGRFMKRPLNAPVWFWLTSIIAGIVAFAEWGGDSKKDEDPEKQSGNHMPIPINMSGIPAGGTDLSQVIGQLNPNNLFAATIHGSTEGGGSGLTILNDSESGGSGIYATTASDLTGANGFAGVQGINTNQGKISGFGVVGVTQSQNGAGVGGFANAGDAAGVLGYTSSPSNNSAGVKAQYAGGGVGTALEVTGGAIKVTGAGVGTNTAVFIHQVTNANRKARYTMIDHPLTNGDPNAILIVTANRTPGGRAFATPLPEWVATEVLYATPESLPDFPELHGHWCLVTVSMFAALMDRPSSPTVLEWQEQAFTGASFNVLVFKTS